MKFNSFYENRPKSIGFEPDTEHKLVDQSEADRVAINYNLERFGMSGIASMFEKTKAQFGYADTRVSKNFAELAQSMAEANSYFMQLPAELRKKFNHNAVDFYTTIEREPEKMWKDGYISKELAGKLGVLSAIDKPVEIVQPQPSDIVQPLPAVNDNISINENKS